MATPARPLREKVAFEPNVVETVTLAYPVGKIVSGRFGEQVMWGLQDDRVMFLDLDVAQKINLLEPQQGESICICKRWNGQKTQPVRWDVWLSPATEQMRAAKEQRANGDLAPQLSASITEANERRHGGALGVEKAGAGLRPAPVVSATTARQPEAKQEAVVSGQPQHNAGLIAEANVLVDAFAVVMERALSMYQGRIKPEEVRPLLLTAYIQRGKAGAHA